ncbi:hypothetical protein [Modestobacter sp. SYSU DS0902]
MTTTLITGGNKSLGFEAARRLTELGHRVVIGARDPSGVGTRPTSWAWTGCAST